MKLPIFLIAWPLLAVIGALVVLAIANVWAIVGVLLGIVALTSLITGIEMLRKQ